MMKIHFPHPIKAPGVLEIRKQLIEDYKKQANNNNYTFRETEPTLSEIVNYFSLVKKNDFSREYLGELMTSDDWRLSASIADFDNIAYGIDKLLNVESCAYFMTNCAGHHADNGHYELFCPLNQLFFIVEYLNYHDNFPEILSIDTDAHFGNGDKKLFEGYCNKMGHETNNLHCYSFHNDSYDIDQPNYRGVNYPTSVTNDNFLNMIDSSIKTKEPVKYLLWFIGTDIIKGDYGGNFNISSAVLAGLVEIMKQKADEMKGRLLIIQAGGAIKANITSLIDVLCSDF